MTNPSFKSAGAYPYKLLYHANSYIRDGGFSPTHIFIYPTYKCNLNCKYCCCGAEDRATPNMSLDTFKGILAATKPKAITFAGGGEPTMHPNLEKFIDFAVGEHIKVGIMTNGVRCQKYTSAFWNKFTWVRISMDAARVSIPYIEHPQLSYIWVGPKGGCFEGLTCLNETGNVASMRITGDIHDHDPGERGAARCFMPLTRPVFVPDGSVYSCCRAHYAIKGSKRMMPDELKVADNAAEYMKNHRPIDGSVCDRCYYGDFNRLMARIDKAMSIQDLEFI